jgi:hypothetical protein
MAKTVEVVAMRTGYLQGEMIRPGDHFAIDETKVSKRWMAKVGTEEYEQFMSHHAPGPKTDAVSGERLASGGIAEELAMITAERNQLRTQVAELEAELRLIREIGVTDKAETVQAPAENEEAETSEPKRVRRRKPKTEG